MTTIEIDKTRSYGYIRVIGESLDPDEITEILGRTPDESWRIGELRRVAGGTYDFHCWLMYLGGSTKDDNFTEHFSESIEALGLDLAGRFASLVESEMEVVCEYVQFVDGEDHEHAHGIGLSVEAIQWLAVARANLDVDQYFDPDGEGTPTE